MYIIACMVTRQSFEKLSLITEEEERREEEEEKGEGGGRGEGV